MEPKTKLFDVLFGAKFLGPAAGKHHCPDLALRLCARGGSTAHAQIRVRRLYSAGLFVGLQNGYYTSEKLVLLKE